MQELQVIVNGIIEDDSINREELDVLNRWLQMHDYLLGFYPFDKIYYAVEAILDDNIMDSDEEKVLLDLLDRFINPDTTNEYVSLDGKVVCLSGDFSYGTKKDVENYISGKGGVIAKNVTQKVDILILGEAGSAAWKYGNYGSKYEKARQLQEKGSNIIVVKEQDIIK
ncbi:MAG: BRCT domain-containing protein [Lachnospiraceae bacterium]|nr:BRCT domain-containing protein [Lachnospiraceae bacterium]MDD7702893.1 BRCT domain-containing protein [Lachnospiraceae bacterium]